jgi:hypothetical protein
MIEVTRDLWDHTCPCGCHIDEILDVGPGRFGVCHAHRMSWRIPAHLGGPRRDASPLQHLANATIVTAYEATLFGERWWS